MKKNLSSLTREDWNQLFPIELVDHDPSWKTTFENEKNRILKSVGNEMILKIEHFGSSSISGIKSKPYIDLLIEIPGHLLFDEKLIEHFSNLGYTHFKVPARDTIEEYSSFGKGYNLEGQREQIFHIHMCPSENQMWKQMDFRNYLIQNPIRAREYEALKLELASKFKNDRGAYVLGKTDFVNDTLDMIKNPI